MLHDKLKSFETTSLKFLLITGAIMLWELKEEDRGFALSCLAEPLEHDNFVSSLSLNSLYQTAVSSSEDRRYNLSGSLLLCRLFLI